jgi:quercetin dioxygenase-like cupin family protein
VAHVGQEIINPRTGQRMRFVELTERQVRIETVNPPTTEREPLHVHPKQESGCDVATGSLVWEVAGQRRVVSAGESVTVPANTRHRFWNERREDARSTQFFRPALYTAAFFETLFGLAQQDQLDASGMPKFLPLMAMVGEFGDEIRPASPPWPVLRALAAAIGPLTRARGHHGASRWRHSSEFAHRTETTSGGELPLSSPRDRDWPPTPGCRGDRREALTADRCSQTEHDRVNDNDALSRFSKTSGAVGATSQTLASPVIAQELAGGGGADARDDERSSRATSAAPTPR